MWSPSFIEPKRLSLHYVFMKVMSSLWVANHPISDGPDILERPAKTWLRLYKSETNTTRIAFHSLGIPVGRTNGSEFRDRQVKMAERGGFEPPIRNKPYAGFRDRCIQPLCHLSNCVGRYWNTVVLKRNMNAISSTRTDGQWISLIHYCVKP